jgi:hypothetical protein
MDFDRSFIALLAVWGAFALVVIILALTLYVLLSYGLYKLAVNQRIDNTWLAWIPIANMYILGKLIKSLKIDAYEIPSIELVLPLSWLVVIIFGSLPLIGWIIRLAYLLLCILAIYKLFKLYKPEQAVLWLILSIVLPFMGPIFIFMIRNDIPVE